ncbi:hypothetical protein Taro_056039 [Colocasia esculenta]|uniref:Uncharacterized protein n=1 Tax=Colocasia esculenta TaxID=4460 RepID=A0A843XSW1_COLES|nr:hypothetical protein [Colocasia esculenta]
MVAFGDFHSDSLDFANRWRSPQAEPPNHSDRKSCSTRREISSPVATPSISRIAGGAHKRSRPVTVIGSRVQLDARSPPQRLPRFRESLAEPTHGAAQSQRLEVVFNSTCDLLPRSWIWVPEHRRYSHALRFIPTPQRKNWA